MKEIGIFHSHQHVVMEISIKAIRMHCFIYLEIFLFTSFLLGILDDRSVRDSERRAAIMHFTSDQVFPNNTFTTINT